MFEEIFALRGTYFSSPKSYLYSRSCQLIQFLDYSANVLATKTAKVKVAITRATSKHFAVAPVNVWGRSEVSSNSSCQLNNRDTKMVVVVTEQYDYYYFQLKFDYY